MFLLLEKIFKPKTEINSKMCFNRYSRYYKYIVFWWELPSFGISLDSNLALLNTLRDDIKNSLACTVHPVRMQKENKNQGIYNALASSFVETLR